MKIHRMKWMALSVGAWLLGSASLAFAQAPAGQPRLVYACPFMPIGSAGVGAYSYTKFVVHVSPGVAPSDLTVFVEYYPGSATKTFFLTLDGDYGDHLTYTGRLVHLVGMMFRVGVQKAGAPAPLWDDNGGARYNITPCPAPISPPTVGDVGGRVGLLEAKRTYMNANIAGQLWPYVGVDITVVTRRPPGAAPGFGWVWADVFFGSSWVTLPGYFSHQMTTYICDSDIDVWTLQARGAGYWWLTWQFWLPMQIIVAYDDGTFCYLDDNYGRNYTLEFITTETVH